MPRAKLNIYQVQQIFTTHKDLSARKIAKLYNVSHAQINLIRAGRSWKTHIALLGLPINDKKNDTKYANQNDV